jgi:hypothetical protein
MGAGGVNLAELFIAYDTALVMARCKERRWRAIHGRIDNSRLFSLIGKPAERR